LTHVKLRSGVVRLVSPGTLVHGSNMQLATTPALVRLQQLQSEQRKAFLVLGGDELPSVEGVNLHSNVDLASAGIILLGRVEAAELASVLDRAADPALPIADFGGNETLRRDFVGSVFDQASVQAMEKAFAPIWQRLSALPFKAERANRAEMTILRLAYTRGTPITAAFDPNSRAVVKYRCWERLAATSATSRS
jgi:hypothetical protein